MSGMRFVIGLVVALLMSGNACAGLAEVRDAARQSNCPPKKIEVLRQSVGNSNETLYQVECNLPKAKDAKADQSKRITVKCQLNLCQVGR